MWRTLALAFKEMCLGHSDLQKARKELTVLWTDIMLSSKSHIHHTPAGAVKRLFLHLIKIICMCYVRFVSEWSW